MFELVLRAPQDLVESLSDALVDELDALSVSVEDADAGTDAERAIFGEPGMVPPATGWQRSTIRALFDSERAADGAATVLLAQDWATALQVRSLQEVPAQDWVRLTQSQFEPVPITDTMWVVASWHAIPPGATRLIRLDPGMAFGTGTHPTTRMCLRWLAALPAPGQARVLDYGCGSGILAIAAALCGAGDVDAVDIDPAAIEATSDNARRNSVKLNVGLPGLAQGRYGLILANILATPLKLLAPLLTGLMQPGATLVLAGILDRQADELAAAYAPFLSLSVSDREDGWVLITGQLAASRS